MSDPFLDAMCDDYITMVEWFNPDVLNVLTTVPLGEPFTAADLAADHPYLPTLIDRDAEPPVLSVWDTLCGFVETHQRLFRQLSEPFGAEWIRVSCCFDHYNPMADTGVIGNEQPTAEQLSRANIYCRKLWAAWNEKVENRNR